jgi:hypothetical protein
MKDPRMSPLFADQWDKMPVQEQTALVAAYTRRPPLTIPLLEKGDIAIVDSDGKVTVQRAPRTPIELPA